MPKNSWPLYFRRKDTIYPESESSDSGYIVSFRRKYSGHEFFGIRDRSQFSVSQPFMNFQIGIVGAFRVILSQRGVNKLFCQSVFFQQFPYIAFFRRSENSKESSGREFSLSVYADIYGSVRIAFYLNPRAARWNYFRTEIFFTLCLLFGKENTE